MKTTARKPPPESASGLESFATGPDGTRLYVRRRVGSGNTVFLLCDGIVCDGYIYKYLWDDLTEFGGVAHWNYRGHGRSGLPSDPNCITVADHARDLDEVRRHLGDPPVVLVGHSFGTQVALEAYRLRPEGVKALVLLCGSFGRVTYTFKGSDMLANVLPQLIDFAERHPRLARGIWSRIPVGLGLSLARLSGDVNLQTVRAEDMRPYFEHAAHVDFEMFLRMLREAGEHSAEDLLPNVKVPALVVTGERDSFTPPAVSQAMAQAMPIAEFALVSGGTHILPLEESDELRSIIAAFLARFPVE
ncbi:MAG: alpha/beta hydrolase [Polyangiaceae bacterium]